MPPRPPSDGGRGDASEERGSAFLARLSPPMQNASRVCLLCWRAFRDAQCRLVLQKWQCLLLLKSVLDSLKAEATLSEECPGINGMI